MGHVCAAVKLSVYYDPAPDACAHRHIDNSRLTFSSAPAGLPEGGGIRAVFEGRRHAELPRQIFHRVVPLPAGEKGNGAKGAAKWVADSGGSSAVAAGLQPGSTA